MMQHDTTIIVVEKEGKFLVVKRLNRPNKGYWCLPGGHVDEGETPFEAAQREAKEEVGDIEVEDKELFSFVHDPRIGHKHHAHVFRGKVVGEVRAGDDAGEFAWLTIDELAELDVTQYTNIVFNRLFPEIAKGDLKNEKK